MRIIKGRKFRRKDSSDIEQDWMRKAFEALGYYEANKKKSTWFNQGKRDPSKISKHKNNGRQDRIQMDAKNEP